jgi:hypothetical protein
MVVLLVAVTGACSSGPTATSAATSTSRPASTSTTVDDQRVGVVRAYEKADKAFVDAGAIPDPEFAALADTHVDPLLEQSRKILRSLKLEGRAARYPTPSRYKVEVDLSSVVIDGDVARLESCVVDDGQVIEVSTGRVLDDRTTTVLRRAAMRRVGGDWRLSEQKTVSRWPGEGGCAVD